MEDDVNRRSVYRFCIFFWAKVTSPISHGDDSTVVNIKGHSFNGIRYTDQHKWCESLIDKAHGVGGEVEAKSKKIRVQKFQPLEPANFLGGLGQLGKVI